jgi:hypothetical protein
MKAHANTRTQQVTSTRASSRLRERILLCRPPSPRLRRDARGRAKGRSVRAGVNQRRTLHLASPQACFTGPVARDVSLSETGRPAAFGFAVFEPRVPGASSRRPRASATDAIRGNDNAHWFVRCVARLPFDKLRETSAPHAWLHRPSRLIEQGSNCPPCENDAMSVRAFRRGWTSSELSNTTPFPGCAHGAQAEAHQHWRRKTILGFSPPSAESGNLALPIQYKQLPLRSERPVHAPLTHTSTPSPSSSAGEGAL